MSDNIITGFYKDAGLYIECPNCHTSINFGLGTFFLAIYQHTNYECDKCKKCLSMNLLINVVDNGFDENDEEE